MLPELLFQVSSLAQRVSEAVWEDLVEAVHLLEVFQDHARDGQAKLKIPAVGVGRSRHGATFSCHARSHYACDLVAMELKDSSSTGRGQSFFSGNEMNLTSLTRSRRSLSKRRVKNRDLEALWYGKLEVTPGWKSELLVPGYLVTDAKSLYDHVHGSSLLASERQTSLDILSVRQLIQEGHLRLFWVPTWKQYGDMLTKSMPDVLFHAFRKKGILCLVESDEDRLEETRRAGIRRGQRERRKARMSSSV